MASKLLPVLMLGHFNFYKLWLTCSNIRICVHCSPLVLAHFSEFFCGFGGFPLQWPIARAKFAAVLLILFSDFVSPSSF
jgi:hypothetical protein